MLDYPLTCTRNMIARLRTLSFIFLCSFESYLDRIAYLNLINSDIILRFKVSS